MNNIPPLNVLYFCDNQMRLLRKVPSENPDVHSCMTMKNCLPISYERRTNALLDKLIHTPLFKGVAIYIRMHLHVT